MEKTAIGGEDVTTVKENETAATRTAGDAAGRAPARRIPSLLVPVVSGLMRSYTRLNVWVFRKSRGRLWTRFPGGFPICVVGMRGAKSGVWREVGLIHLPVTDRPDSIYLVASQGGLPKHPAWFHNVRANPDITVMLGGREWPVRARQLSDKEKAAAWPDICRLYPPFAEYQSRTDRDIPVFICEPVSIAPSD